MKRFRTLLCAALGLLLSATFISCSDTNEEYVYIHEPAPEPEYPLLGTYTFDNVEYPIYNAVCIIDELYCTFRFSPLKEAPLTTSLAFQLSKAYIGVTCDIDRLFHNDDYRLIYEDPARYYSYFRKLQGGTVRVDPQPTKGENYFVIDLDVRLADGKPLKLAFEGELAPATAAN